MRHHLASDIIIFVFALFIFYSISDTSLEISEKSPADQRDQSFIFPLNFSSSIQTPLYSKFIYLIMDGVTYDFADNRVQNIPNSTPECDIHTHKIPIFNELLSEQPENVVFQRLQIESPPKTEIKISTYLKGTNPAFFSMQIPEADPYQLHMQDSILYQVGQSPNLQKNYGFLTYYLYNYVGYHLTRNQFALDPFYTTYEQLKSSDVQKNQEYMNILKSNDYDTLFIYEGIVDEVGHLEGMHTPDVLDAHQYLDSVIRGIVNNMDNDTVLIATSDHGKNEAGSHFDCHGVDDKVCNAVLFAYTKQGFVQNDSFIQTLRRKEDNERISSQAGQFSAHESMISSTLSNLLNIPISYINSGRSLLELYPTSKFNNRLELLQRVLQDSFTTLEQQKQFFENIQKKTSIFNKSQYTAIMSQIAVIENTLFYELRDTIIYSESSLEQIITQIVDLQNQIQGQIYNNNFYSYNLLIFGIVISLAIAIAVFARTLIGYVIRSKEYKLYAFILVSSVISIIIYFYNDISLMTFQGTIISFLLVIYLGKTELKSRRRLIEALMLLSLNLAISFSQKYSTDALSSFKVISTICDMMIFILHAERIESMNNSSNGGQIHKRSAYLQISLLFATVDGVLHQLSLNFISMFLNVAFYCYSLFVQNKLNLDFLKRENFKIDLVLINIFWLFLGTFSNNSNFENCSTYYPILLVSIYLLCDFANSDSSVFNSVYMQVQILVSAGVLFQLFNLETNYISSDFSILLILCYYSPLPFIPLLFLNKKSNIQKISPNASPSLVPNHHSDASESQTIISIAKDQVIGVEVQKAKQVEPKEAVKPQENLKDGLIVFSMISIFCSCLGQVLIIYNQQIFAMKNDPFIFSSEYLMSIVFVCLLSNIFIR